MQMVDVTDSTRFAAIPPIFDGHNDTLLRLRRKERPIASFFERGDEGHIDLPRAREGGLAGGFFAVFVPSPGPPLPADPTQASQEALRRFGDPSNVPTGPALAEAQRTAIEMSANLFRIEAASAGGVKVVRAVDELATCIEHGTFAAILHFEGAEALDTELHALEFFYQAGLRSLGLVWSRPNDFAHGVPFKFPASPDTGPGLTAAGRELVRACNRLGVMIDLSHLNERGFWDVAKLSDKPLVATHSNAHALSASTRNLLDKQLDAIAESDGMVGLNFAVGFLREDGQPNAATPLETMVRHIDYLVGRVGLDRVGLGSDFDGAMIPQAIGDAAGLPRLRAALREAGYDDDALRKLGYENWLRVLRKTWR